LQKNHTKFEYGQVHAFKPHLVYNQGWTLYIAFLLAIEDLLLARTMQQTIDWL
jgi:hypothetical protein